jgi:predicted methyltransferase
MTRRDLSIAMMTFLLAGACGGSSSSEPAAPAPAPAPAEPAATDAETPATDAETPAPAAEPAAPVQPADPVQAAIDAPGRPAADRERDAARKPRETLEFFGIKPGMQVAEIMTASGWYAEILARVVGPDGHLFAQNNKLVDTKFAQPELDERLKKPELANVTKLVTEYNKPGLPAGQLDAVLAILVYHDQVWMKTNRKKMNAAIFAALKPGGVYGIIDHDTVPGAGTRQAKTLHRIEKSVVVKEVLAAGFTLDAESDLLRHPDDDHSKNVFDETIRGKTDQFMLRFRKP